MEEKENVNQNPKIAKFPIQNNVCFHSSPDQARRLYDHFLSLARIRGVKVETGESGATMEVDLVNNDPVTIILDSRET
jgi:D-Tyr-tRNAtyr deacylase